LWRTQQASKRFRASMAQPGGNFFMFTSVGDDIKTGLSKALLRFEAARVCSPVTCVERRGPERP
jgi:hypothetical protein